MGLNERKRRETAKLRYSTIVSTLFCSGALLLYGGALLTIQWVMLVGFLFIFGAIITGVIFG